MEKEIATMEDLDLKLKSKHDLELVVLRQKHDLEALQVKMKLNHEQQLDELIANDEEALDDLEAKALEQQHLQAEMNLKQGFADLVESVPADHTKVLDSQRFNELSRKQAKEIDESTPSIQLKQQHELEHMQTNVKQRQHPEVEDLKITTRDDEKIDNLVLGCKRKALRHMETELMQKQAEELLALTARVMQAQKLELEEVKARLEGGCDALSLHVFARPVPQVLAKMELVPWVDDLTARLHVAKELLLGEEERRIRELEAELKLVKAEAAAQLQHTKDHAVMELKRAKDHAEEKARVVEREREAHRTQEPH